MRYCLTQRETVFGSRSCAYESITDCHNRPKTPNKEKVTKTKATPKKKATPKSGAKKGKKEEVKDEVMEDAEDEDHAVKSPVSDEYAISLSHQKSLLTCNSEAVFGKKDTSEEEEA